MTEEIPPAGLTPRFGGGTAPAPGLAGDAPLSAGEAVPLIDLAGALAGQPAARRETAGRIDQACRDTGFFCVSGHGVPAGRLAALIETARGFFGRPREEKKRYLSPSGNPFRGWSALDTPGASGPVLLREQFEVSGFDRRADLAAAGYGPEWVERFEESSWPADPPGMEAAWKSYLVEVERLGLALLALMAEALGLPAGWFGDKFARQSSYLCCNHFPAPATLLPAYPGTPGSDGVSFAEHTDIGSLTLLHQDGGPGRLQILHRNGAWVDVPHRPGTYVVNLGDLMAKWTNDRWVATRHRVLLATPGEAGKAGELGSRFSVPYFQHPDYDALIECLPTCRPAAGAPRYPAVRAGDWASHRFANYDDDVGPQPGQGTAAS